MSDTDNGGSAFPFGDYTNGGEQGMTLRDYFAAAALTGSVCYVNEFEPELEASLLHTAQAAYRIADAMLAARKENQS